tara:strand:+ start:1503 stop:1676 length:174 start_codon:yes stop_codon:yes gene_type:complete
MDFESKKFKIALKELPKEDKIDERKVFITSKAVNKTRKEVKEVKKKKKNIVKKYNKK